MSIKQHAAIRTSPPPTSPLDQFLKSTHPSVLPTTTTMAATHAHYIRTIHTTFTAAHPHSSSAWASAASTASSQYLNNLNLTLNSINYNPRSSSPAPAPAVQQNTSINTHNTHMYTHHLRDLTHSPRHNQHHSQQQGVSLPQHGQQYHSQQQHQQPGSNSRLPKPITDARSTSPSPTTLSLPYPHSPVQTQVHQMGGASEMPVRTRRRSASIRGAPSSMSMSLSSKRPKFDPFADEPIVPVLSLSSEAASTTATATAITDASANANGKTDLTAEVDVEANTRKHEAPYTIQIPAAQQDDIQMYAVFSGATASEPPATPRLAPASLPSRPLSPRAPSFTPMALKSTATGNASASPSAVSSATGPCNTPTVESASAQPAAQTQTQTPVRTPTRTPSPPLSVTQTQMQMQIPTPNLSKVVASILLNRVHAVGKPMRVRRRAAIASGAGCGGVGYQRVGTQAQAPVQGNGYVKSCLSSVVSVEA